MRVFAELAKFLTKYCEENGYVEIAALTIASVLILTGLGAVLGWLIGRRAAVANILKATAETRKMDVETSNELAKLLASVGEKREALREQRKQMKLFLKEVLEKIKAKRTKGLRAIREDVCELNSSEYMPALNDYLDDCVLLLPKKIAAARIASEIIPSLKQQHRIYTMVNHEHFLDTLKVAGRYELDQNACDGIFSTLRSRTPFYHRKTRKSIKKLERQFKAFTK